VKEPSPFRKQMALATALFGIALLIMAFGLSFSSLPIPDAIYVALAGTALVLLAVRLAPGLGIRRATPMVDPERTLSRDNQPR
jgi:hypothetical protein